MTIPSQSVTTFLAKLAERARESRTRAAARDTPLAKLISGELRMKDAEHFAENVM